jgi:hypothetical protein
MGFDVESVGSVMLNSFVLKGETASHFETIIYTFPKYIKYPFNAHYFAIVV